MGILGIPRLLKAVGIGVWLISAGVLAGSENAGGPVDVGVEPLLAGVTAVYRGGDGLYALRQGGDKPAPVGPRIKGPGISLLNPQLAERDGRMAAAWLEKRPEGNRLFAVAANAQGVFPADPTPIAGKTATTAVALEPLADGFVLLDAAPGPKPALFATVLGKQPSARKALSLGDIEVLHSFSTATTGRFLHVFLHGRKQGHDFIGMMDYDTEGQTSGPLEAVAEIPATPLVQAFTVKGAPAVLFKVYENGRFSVRLAIRGETGWRSSPVTGTEGLDVARIDQAAWPDGRILLVFSGEQREKTKQRVYAADSTDLGARWRTRQLDSAAFGNTRAWLPRMAVAGDRVAVVWEDARDIRSRIRMQISEDRGQTWLAHDLPLSAAQSYAMRPRIDSTRDQFRVAWQQFRSDARDQADLILRGLKWEEAYALAGEAEKNGAAGPDGPRKPLADAVDAFWRAMETRDQQAAYLAHDPFYRAKVAFPQYVSHWGPLVYHRHEIKNLAIQGNEATATVLVKVSSEKAPGPRQPLPPADHTLRDTWLFIDGHWYRKYVDSLSGGSAINY